MADAPNEEIGDPLSIDEYVIDFQRVQDDGDQSTLKLESSQNFIEPGNQSWELFNVGRWRESIQVALESKSELKQYFHDLLTRGITTRRVRVVHDPISPYFWWECQVLILRAEAGEEIRVVTDAVAKNYFSAGLQELLFVGDSVMYEVKYGPDGAGIGAVKHTDPALLSMQKEKVEQLFAEGENFASWFRLNLPTTPQLST